MWATRDAERQKRRERERKRTRLGRLSAGDDSGTFGRTLFLSSGGVDRTIPSPAGELWEQMAAAAVSSTRSLGGGRGSGLFSLS